MSEPQKYSCVVDAQVLTPLLRIFYMFASDLFLVHHPWLNFFWFTYYILFIVFQSGMHLWFSVLKGVFLDSISLTTPQIKFLVLVCQHVSVPE